MILNMVVPLTLCVFIGPEIWSPRPHTVFVSIQYFQGVSILGVMLQLLDLKRFARFFVKTGMDLGSVSTGIHHTSISCLKCLYLAV